MYKDRYYTKKRYVDYDANLINEILECFKGLKPEDVNIFFDMDNTLFVFSVHSNDLLSLELQKNKGFFANLRPYEEGPMVLKTLMELGFNVYILSACADEDCKKEKRQSLAKHFPFLKDEQIIFVMNGENKAEKIKERGISLRKSILVDDYYVNLINWMAEGGLAIKKTFSGKKRVIPQVHDLRELYVLLACILQVDEKISFNKLYSLVKE